MNREIASTELWQIVKTYLSHLETLILPNQNPHFQQLLQDTKKNLSETAVENGLLQKALARLMSEVATYGVYAPAQEEPRPSVPDFDKNSTPYPPELASIVGLAIGDSLGATSEFAVPWQVPSLMKDSKWPQQIIGGGAFAWSPGEPTDDTAMAVSILRSASVSLSANTNSKPFSGEAVASQFLKWIDTHPPDVGATTRQALNRLKKLGVKNYWRAAQEQHKQNPNNEANGSLMRNGAIPPLFWLFSNVNYTNSSSSNSSSASSSYTSRTSVNSWNELISGSVLHGIITHYNPFPVMCCVIHSVLIQDAIICHKNEKQPMPPTLEQIRNILNTRWKQWKDQLLIYITKRTQVQSQTTASSEYEDFIDIDVLVSWFKDIGGNEKLKQAEDILIAELSDFVEFNPFCYQFKGKSGWCTLSLKIALWALHWSFQPESVVPTCGIPPWLPKWIFCELRGFRSLTWVVSFGADADTYGAITGALLGAYYPKQIPFNFATTIKVMDELTQLLKMTQNASSS